MSTSQKLSRSVIFAGVSAFALTIATSAAAQVAPVPAAEADPGDIVVTAQRREQRLQDVGIAVTAMSGDALQQMNVQNAMDLSRIVPTLKMNAYSSAQVVFNIRGVSQNDFGDQQEPPVAVYQDDSYASSINLSSFPTFDLARVEVLRGPQGTLFGRNATGGAVQFISNKPAGTFGGYATIGTGSYGQIVTEGAVTGPLSDTLQFRLAGTRERDTGYIKNINPGFPDQGASNHWALRGILAWQPADGVATTLTLRYLRAPKERQAGMYTLASACPNAQFQGEFLRSDEICGYWVGIGNPGPGTIATGYRNDAIMPQFGGNPWRTATKEPGYVDRKVFGATFRAEIALGVVDIVSITDYQYGKKFLTGDEDGSPDLATTFSQGSRLNQASQEIRVLAHLGRHELATGVYGMTNDGDYTGSFGDPFYGYLPQVAFSQKTRSYAFFAQDEWALTDRIKLIGGLRYWHDKRIGDYAGAEPSTGVSLRFNPREISYSSFGVVQLSTGLTVTPADAAPTFDGLTARAQIDYKPTDRLLVYASYNRGSKSGGFTFSTGTPFPGAEVSALNGTPYRPEKLDAFELGVKSTLAAGTTLNIAGFVYQYHDYQAFAQYGSVQTVVNLKARSKGVEVEFATRPVRGLSLQLSGSFLDTAVLNVPLPDLSSIVDHDLPQSPGFSGNATARYAFDVLGGTASVQAAVQHSGAFCFTVLCAPVEREGSYNLASARIGYAPAGGKWEVAAFVNNIFEERYRIYAFDESLFGGNVAGAYGRPRVWGLTGTVRFGSGG